MQRFRSNLQKWSLLVLLQMLGTIFEAKQPWAPFLPRFSGILPKFSNILPKFSTNQNFWGCACISATYITAGIAK